jgi:hypothetical protein
MVMKNRFSQEQIIGLLPYSMYDVCPRPAAAFRYLHKKKRNLTRRAWIRGPGAGDPHHSSPFGHFHGSGRNPLFKLVSFGNNFLSGGRSL